MRTKIDVLLVAIPCIMMMEVVAILNGINGAVFATAIGAVTFLAGLAWGKLDNVKKVMRNG